MHCRSFPAGHPATVSSSKPSHKTSFCECTLQEEFLKKAGSPTSRLKLVRVGLPFIFLC